MDNGDQRLFNFPDKYISKWDFVFILMLSANLEQLVNCHWNEMQKRLYIFHKKHYVFFYYQILAKSEYLFTKRHELPYIRLHIFLVRLETLFQFMKTIIPHIQLKTTG